MKRLIAVLLALCIILTACGNSTSTLKSDTNIPSKPSTENSVEAIKTVETEVEKSVTESVSQSEKETDIQLGELETEPETQEEREIIVGYDFKEEPISDFGDLDDEKLQRYLEDSVYAEVVKDLNSEDFFVTNVSTTYISKEYLEELSYNSKENVFFGYSLSELDNEFQGKKYMFTVDKDGKTVVTEVEGFDDTYEKVLKNVAIGAGVILICVTVSAVTGGAGAPAASMIFAVSAKSGAVAALSGGVIGGVAAGTVEGIKTRDFNKALKAAALGGSEGFKWGAIGGSISGGVAEAVALKGAAVNLTMDQVAIIQKESNYPLDIIKQFHTMEEYEQFKAANLKPLMVNSKIALVRNDIDLNYVDEKGLTNLERMKKGLAPLDPDGIPYELHHIGQKNDATLAILTRSEHDSSALHGFVENSEITRTAFDKVRSEFWKAMANLL